MVLLLLGVCQQHASHLSQALALASGGHWFVAWGQAVAIHAYTLNCHKLDTKLADLLLFTDCGKCLYISGIPGTGKTATVLEVMRGLKRKR